MASAGAPPDQDPQLTMRLTEKFNPPLPPTAAHYPVAQDHELLVRYHLFFEHLFDTVRESIEMTPEIMAPHVWQRHLLDEAINQGKTKTMNNRKVLYQNVVNRVKGDNMLKEARRVRSCPF